MTAGSEVIKNLVVKDASELRVARISQESSGPVGTKLKLAHNGPTRYKLAHPAGT